MWHSVMNNCEWLWLHVGEDCNKGINNPNGVFCGVTLYNWWSEVVSNRNIVQYFILVMVLPITKIETVFYFLSSYW
jgi:hypothetical protein